MTYEGKHRAPTSRRGRIVAAIAAGLAAVLLIGTPANAAPVTVRAGDTYSGLVQRHCAPGTSWQSLDFGGRNKNLIYAGEVVDIKCTATAAPRAATASAGWVAPVGACIVSGYGWRWGRMHNGVDLAAGYGVPIRAAAAGQLRVAWQSGAGNYSTITHANGVATVYMHLSSYAVRSGWVNAGQVIGYVGATGNASGPHLHFEVHPWGLWRGQTNPVPFMSARGVTLRWC